MSLYEDPDVAAAAALHAEAAAGLHERSGPPVHGDGAQYNEVSNIFFTNVSDVLTGKQKGADAVANIELDLEDLLGFEVGAPN